MCLMQEAKPWGVNVNITEFSLCWLKSFCLQAPSCFRVSLRNLLTTRQLPYEDLQVGIREGHLEMGTPLIFCEKEQQQKG